MASEPIELTRSPARSGAPGGPRSRRLEPFTNWNHWGRKMIAPKKPKVTSIVAASNRRTVRLRNSDAGRSALVARDSIHRKTSPARGPQDQAHGPTPGSVQLAGLLVGEADEERMQDGRGEDAAPGRSMIAASRWRTASAGAAR